MKGIIPIIIAIIIMGIAVPTVNASSPAPSGHVLVYSTYTNSSENLYVPANSTGVSVYPDWHIYIFGTGNFTFTANGTVIETGYSVNEYMLNYSWTTPIGTHVKADLIFQGIIYVFLGIISGPLSNTIIDSVQMSSHYTGQDQYLTVAPGISSAVVYPNWTVTMQSTQNVAYNVYANGQLIMSGYVLGSKTINFTVSGSTVTVIIGLGSKIFKFPNEIISSVPISKYYGPKPEPLQFTFAQYEQGLIKAFVASLFAIIVALFTARKYLLEKEKREVIRI